MAKVNKYFEILEENSKVSVAKLHELSKNTLAAMNEAILMYSKQGAQIKVNQLYQQALEQAKTLKNQELESLKAVLSNEKAKLQPPQVTDINEKILMELQKLNQFNSFNASIRGKTTEEIVGMSHEQYLNPTQVNLIRAELSERASMEQNKDEKTRLNNLLLGIQYVSPDMLLQQAYERLDSYTISEDMFPGLSIADSLTGGVTKLLGKDIVEKVNEVQFFENSKGNEEPTNFEGVITTK